ncbi:TetR/AcrR family transcriptional regulator [Marinilabilia salmonicolor]|uniref:TetR/AcrR family transcriptional regulator n=1 Tax=Marinilabilia salmonicolor TaxID=989 RepID=UPI00029A8F97|nr:TetR/AcrR family transcriptional regulator [Marinilabilia salmonicolor]
MKNKVLDLDRIMNLYFRYGVKNLTMDDVAQELGISKRTLYQQVTTKNELVDMVLNDQFSKYREAVSSIVDKEDGSIRKLYCVYKLIADFFKPLTPVFVYSLNKMSSKLAEELHRKYNDFIVEIFGRIVDEGEEEGIFLVRFKDDFARLVAGYLFQTNEKGAVLQMAEIDLNNAFYLQTSGVCTDHGRKVLNQLMDNPKLLTA